MKQVLEPVKIIFFGILLLMLSSACTDENKKEAYLFAYFNGNGPGQEQVHYAISRDGYNYKALNGNQPVVESKNISSSGGVRDPHIIRKEDNNGFYMVATDEYVPTMGWNNHALVLMKSTDMLTWESTVVDIPQLYPTKFGQVNRVWAPQTIYDEEAGKYMVYFSMLEPNSYDIIYYAYANEDFTGFESEPKQLFFSATENACIDGDIIKKDGKFYMFFKSEDGKPGIKLAVSDSLTGGYVQQGNQRVDKESENVEGSCVFKCNDSDEWILMYDVYMKGKYQFTKTSDLTNFSVIDDEVSMNFHPRHGSVLSITKDEMHRLIAEFGILDKSMIAPLNDKIKSNNIDISIKDKTIYLPVKNGTDLSTFNPEFKSSTDLEVSPSTAQDFTSGSVEYTFSNNDGINEIFMVTAHIDNNPVLEGFHADPDVLYSKKDKRFYIYPTSDGFHGWSGTFFKVFSSDNLVDWKMENVIIDLKKDVTWADRNAWAPCIEEKLIDGKYKYFYYFTAAQKIGVAVSDSPVGPFVDLGKPLVNTKPKGISGGQEIDPDIFTDPATGKSYFYWGNGYMAGVELNDDMTSFDQKAVKIMTPDRTFREGVYVFFRKGIYYFLWSDDDTRSPNYKVRYATSTSPLGELSIPENNIVIQKRPEDGIYGTGHNSVLQVGDTDEWYVVYHRFNRPRGIEMGGDAGFNREVCIDQLQFNEDGSIIEVIPTVGGVTAK